MIDLLVKCIRASPKFDKLRKILSMRQIKPRCFVIMINKYTNRCYIHDLKTEIMPTSAKHTCPIYKPSLVFPQSHGSWIFVNLSTRSRSCARRIGDSKNDILQCVPTNVDIVGDLDASRSGKPIHSAILGPDYVSLYQINCRDITNRAAVENQMAKNWKSFLNDADFNNIEQKLASAYKGLKIEISKI